MIRALLLAFVIGCGWLPAASAQAVPPDAPRQVLVMLPVAPAHFRTDSFYSGGYAETPGRAARRRVAADLARAHGLKMSSDWPMPGLGLDCYVMDVPANLRADEVAASLNTAPGVAWAQVMNLFQPLGHDDPLFDQQVAAREWALAPLHEWATGRGVRVAIIDSGVQGDHPDLTQRVVLRRNLVRDRPDAPELHGTAVAGIIAARADNRVGIAGVAPQASILALRACWQASAASTLCTSLSLAQALGAAIDGQADVVNLSLGGPSDRLVQRLVESALAHDIAVVAASNPAAPDGGFPADLPGVIAVADAPQVKPSRILFAPGIGILTTLPGSRWGLVSGSSYAAAHVSGLVALMIDARSRDPAFRNHGRPPGSGDLAAGPDGRVDACASLARVAPGCGCRCTPHPQSDPVAHR